MEIEFSLIPDTQQDLDVIQKLVADFTHQTGIQVILKPLTWENAWSVILPSALHGRGADVSHVGSTMVSSLVVMNALSPFMPEEIKRVGGSKAFAPAVWTSTVLEGDAKVWSLPWTIYTYVIVYRRDLLERVGVEEATAFDTPEQLALTVQKLGALKGEIIPWLMPIIGGHNIDALHLAASWVWAMGGDFLDAGGQKACFEQPAAIAGFRAFMEAHHASGVDAEDYRIDLCMQDFLTGKVAATIVDLRTAHLALKNPNPSPALQQAGFKALFSSPWCGGGDLVIWRHAQGQRGRLQAALSLVEFLTSKSTMSVLGKDTFTLPARLEALYETIPPASQLHSVTRQIAETGKAYRQAALWQRIESQLGPELGRLVIALHTDPQFNLSDALVNRVTALAKRLNMAFS